MKTLMVVLLLACAADAQDVRSVLSVCEVLQDPAKYNGQMIAIRGVVSLTDEGAWLTGHECQRPLITGGYKWLMLIWLTAPTHPDVRGTVNFERDDQSFLRYGEVLQREKYDPARDVLWVTHYGLFLTYSDLERHVRRYPSGEQRGIGFGHLNWAPAELVVKSWSTDDIVIERKPK